MLVQKRARGRPEHTPLPGRRLAQGEQAIGVCQGPRRAVFWVGGPALQPPACRAAGTAAAGAESSMPGRVVPLLPQNAILELGCLDAAPFSGAASVSPARGSPRWRSVPGAPGVSPGPPATPGGRQEHGWVVAGLGTWPRGCCTQHGPPGSRELGPSSRCVPRRTASPRHGHMAREATSRSPAPGWGQFLPCPPL